MPVDLHCHTRLSDGSVTMEELMRLAAMRGLSGISATDHDAVCGAEDAVRLGEKYGLRVLPGVEMSAMDKKRGRRVHILAYLFSKPELLEPVCKSINDERDRCAEQMMDKLREDYIFDRDMVYDIVRGGTSIFKQHIMHSLMHAGYSASIFGELYTKLFDAKTGRYNINCDYPDVFEIVKLLREAQAVIVLAHPSVYSSMELLPELIDAGIDGVEVWHPRNKPEDITVLTEIAREHDLLMTGGSDFHGMYSSRVVRIGQCTAPDSTIDSILARKQRIYGSD